MPGGALTWLILAFFGFVALLSVLRILFRRMRRDLQNSDSRASDFQLEDLRKLEESGQMSQEEYRRARDVILSRTDAKFEPVKGFPVLGRVDQGKSKRTG